jgi:hypothetical protein
MIKDHVPEIENLVPSNEIHVLRVKFVVIINNN